MKKEEQIEVTAVAKHPLKLENVEQGLCAKEVSSKQSLLWERRHADQQLLRHRQAKRRKQHMASRTLSKCAGTTGTWLPTPRGCNHQNPDGRELTRQTVSFPNRERKTRQHKRMEEVTEVHQRLRR